jgi:putative flippase GtrA
MPIRLDSHFIRFGMVSVVGVVLDLGIAWTLSHLAGVSLTLSALCGFTVAAAFNYVLHELWTFGKASSLSARRSGLYLLSLAVTLAVRLSAVASIQYLFGLGRGQELFALIPGVGLSFVANYLMSKYLIFGTRDARST